MLKVDSYASMRPPHWTPKKTYVITPLAVRRAEYQKRRQEELRRQEESHRQRLIDARNDRCGRWILAGLATVVYLWLLVR